MKRIPKHVQGARNIYKVLSKKNSIFAFVLILILAVIMMPGWSFASTDSIDETVYQAQVLDASGMPVYDVGVQGKFESLQAAIDAAQTGHTVKMLKDVALKGNSGGYINISKSITLDGGGYEITGYGKRGDYKVSIDINQDDPIDGIDVDIRNLKINPLADKGRAIETRATSQKMVNSLKLDNVTISSTNSQVQGITIGNTHSEMLTFDISNSTIKTDTGIKVMNPSDITLDRSLISGSCAAYFGDADLSTGSYGSKLKVQNGSVLAGADFQYGESSANTATVFTTGLVDIDVSDSKVIAGSNETQAQDTDIQNPQESNAGSQAKTDDSETQSLQNRAVFRVDNKEESQKRKLDSKITISENSEIIAAGNDTAIFYVADRRSPQTKQKEPSIMDIRLYDGFYKGAFYSKNADHGDIIPEGQLVISSGHYEERPDQIENPDGLTMNYVADGSEAVMDTSEHMAAGFLWTVVEAVQEKLLTYSVDDAGTWSIGMLSGGGEVEVGSQVNLHASSVKGHTFMRWTVASVDYAPYSAYDETALTEISTEQNFTWTVPSDVPKDSNGNIRVVAVYQVTNTEASVMASAVNADNEVIPGVTIGGDIGRQHVGAGKSITAPETLVSGDEKLKFRYWVNENGNLLTMTEKYTFDLFADICVRAVYTPAGEERVLVIFESETKQLLSAEIYTITEQGVQEINDAVPPSKMGYAFTGWTVDGSSIVTYDALKSYIAANGNGVVRVSPLYSKKPDTYNVIVEMYIPEEGGRYRLVKTVTVIEGMAVGDACELTASPSCEYDGITYFFNRFTDENGSLILSTSRTMTLRPASDRKVYAIYESETAIETVSVVTTDCGSEDEIDIKDNTKVYNKVFFTMSYIVPDNYEFIEAGILYSTNESKVTGAQPTGTLHIPSSGTANKGNYTLHIDVTGFTDTVIYARGYVKYKSEGGEMITEYADNILSRAYGG